MTIDWGTKIISIPKTDLTLVGGTTYSYDANVFHLAMKDLEDDEEGMPFPDTHTHVAPIVLGLLSLGRVVEVINGYTITFEDGQYGVDILNGNTNIKGVLNRNQVSVGTDNSAGLVSINDMNLMIHAGVGNVDVSAGNDKVYIRDEDLNILRTLTVSNEGRTKRVD